MSKKILAINGQLLALDDSLVAMPDMNLQDKTIVPTAVSQVVMSDAEFTGLNSVTIEGDTDLIPENIAEGKNIFGVIGSFKGGEDVSAELTEQDDIIALMQEAIATKSAAGMAEPFAFISVTYPEGSVCTCTDGQEILTAKDTDGTYVFCVPHDGEWTVTSTDSEDNTKTKSQIVEITEEGQFENIELIYEFVLFDNGVVDGISWDLHSSSNRGLNDTSTVDDKIRINHKSNVGWAAGSASYEIDLTEYEALKLLGKVNWENTEALYPAYIGVTDTVPTSGGGDGEAAVVEASRLAQTKLATTEEIYTVDISDINGVHRIIFGGTDNAEASRIWLE